MNKHPMPGPLTESPEPRERSTRRLFKLKQTMRFLSPGLIFLLIFCTPAYCMEAVYVETPTMRGRVPVKPWKALRDTDVCKQDLDYSCGAASLVTLINAFYAQSLTEAEVLEVMDKGDVYISFRDMKEALPAFGFRAVGYAASYEQLTRLKIPVVVYIKHRKEDHFSVLRGIDEKTVWLADPSLGNRTYSREQFLAMWETRENKAPNPDLKGRILAVLPDAPEAAAATDSSSFFTKSPARQTARALQHITIRHYP